MYSTAYTPTMTAIHNTSRSLQTVSTFPKHLHLTARRLHLASAHYELPRVRISQHTARQFKRLAATAGDHQPAAERSDGVLSTALSPSSIDNTKTPLPQSTAISSYSSDDTDSSSSSSTNTAYNVDSTSSSNEEDGIDDDDGGDTSSSKYKAQIQLDMPRRSMQVTFTCNRCNGRTERLVNPIAWNKGLVIAQCGECKAWHKLADAANLVDEIRFDVEEQQDAVDNSDFE